MPHVREFIGRPFSNPDFRIYCSQLLINKTNPII